MKLNLPTPVWEWLMENRGSMSAQAFAVKILKEHSETKDTNGEFNEQDKQRDQRRV